MSSIISERPAATLGGMTLPNGWKVIEAKGRPRDQGDRSGGNFSFGYIVENADGKRGFLKAFDFSRVIGESQILGQPPVDVLGTYISAYQYERDLLLKAAGRRMSRVIVALDHGQISVDPQRPLDGTVYYVICEEANGDIRHYLEERGMDDAFGMRCLHHIAVGIKQLHGIGTAHQDVKPSNILTLLDERSVGSVTVSKIADLGCANTNGQTFRSGTVAGDPAYAPIELLYRFVSEDWNIRRFGCDLYHLGNMATFLFSDVNITASILDYLPAEYHYDNWGGTYDEVLPYIQAAFSDALDSFSADVPVLARQGLRSLIEELCNPDPRLRGAPKYKRGSRNSHSLEPYISKLDLLASKLEMGIRRA